MHHIFLNRNVEPSYITEVNPQAIALVYILTYSHDRDAAPDPANIPARTSGRFATTSGETFYEISFSKSDDCRTVELIYCLTTAGPPRWK
jgi:hypothetical protein